MVNVLPVSALISWPTMVAMLMTLDVSDPLNPYFLLDPRGGDTSTVEWKQVELADVGPASRTSVAAQCAIVRPLLRPHALADAKRFDHEPKHHGTSGPPRVPTRGGGRPIARTVSPPTPARQDAAPARRQATIALLPAPAGSGSPAIWNRLAEGSSHTDVYGDYLASLGLATPRANATQLLTLHHLDVNGAIGWV